jgi:branched-chain amino acid transport system ATP-binding protein
MLQVQDLTVGYGPSVVVHGISLEVERGEIVSLLGRNGAGKTTTLRSTVGQPAAEVEVLVGQQDGDVRATDLLVMS